MELDELKILLKEQPVTMRVVKSPNDIAALLGSKTKSVTGKIRRSLKIEIVACIVFAILCAGFGIFGAYTWLRIYFGIFALICLLFLPVLFILFKKATDFGSTDLPVKRNLQRLVNLMQEFVKRYFQITMALIPVSIVMAFLLGYYSATPVNTNLQNTPPPNFGSIAFKITALIAYLVFFGWGMYYFTKWYLKKLYGNYTEQLQALIKELEE